MIVKHLPAGSPPVGQPQTIQSPVTQPQAVDNSKAKHLSLRDSRTKQLNMSQEYIDKEDEAIEKYVEDNWNFIMSPTLEKTEKDLDHSTSLEDYQEKLNTTSLSINNAMKKGTDANTQSFINGLINSEDNS